MTRTDDVPGTASFCIPPQSISTLVEARASAGAICAYLILSAYSDSAGTASTAGLGAIRVRLGIRESVAARLVDDLIQYGLIQDLRPGVGKRSAARTEARFFLPDFGTAFHERVWFCRSLVDIHKRFGSPVKKLYQLQPQIVSMFLRAHELHSEFGVSVRPPQPSLTQSGLARNYCLSPERDLSSEDHAIMIAYPSALVSWGLPFPAQEFDQALPALRSLGFVYESILVFNRPFEKPPGESEEYLPIEAQPLYMLHTRKPAFALPPDEQGLATKLIPFCKSHAPEMIFEDGKTMENYVVIAKPGHDVSVAGVFRLRYRVRNPRNRGVSAGWFEMMQSHREYETWADAMLKKHVYC